MLSACFCLQASPTHEFGLGLHLKGKYDVLKPGLTANTAALDVLRVNPQSLNRLLGLGNTLFKTDTLGFAVNSDTFLLDGSQKIAGTPFAVTAGAAPSIYKMLLLGLGVLGATARRRVRQRQDTPTTRQR
jgi:hypothetical protein